MQKVIEFIQNNSYYVLRVIIILCLLDIGIITLIIFLYYEFNYPHIEYLVYILLVFGLAWTIWGIVRYKNKSQILPAINKDFQVLSQTHTHRLISKQLIVHTRNMTLRALRSGLTSYKNQFRWTGTSWTLVSDIKEQRVNLLDKFDLQDRYEVVFNRTLVKGDEVEIQLTWQLEDAKEIAQPFLSATIYEPTERLKMVLEIGERMRYEEIVCDEILTKGGYVMSSKVHNISSNGHFEWLINEPKLLYQYEMRWV